MRRISNSDIIYAEVLLDRDVPFEAARQMHRIFQNAYELVEILEDPTIDIEKKYNIIDKVFDPSVCGFLKMTVKNKMIYDIRAIYNAYKEMYFKKKNMVLAKIHTAGEISDEQLEELRDFIIKRFGYVGVEFEIEHDESLIGGFVLKVDDFEYDKSIKGMMNNLKEKLTGK